MNIKGKHYRTVWVSGDGKAVEIIDQTKLPFKFEVVALTSAEMVPLRLFRICGFVALRLLVSLQPMASRWE